MRRIVIKRRQLQHSSNNHSIPSRPPPFLPPFLTIWPTDMQLTPKESQASTEATLAAQGHRRRQQHHDEESCNGRLRV